MTRETAAKCVLLMQSNRRHRREQNLEKTYFPFPYRQKTTRKINVKIATNITIEIPEGLKIIENLTWRSQSTTDW